MHASPRRYIFRSHVFQRTNSRLSFQRKEGEREREREVWSERKRGEGGERVWKRQWGWSSEIQKHLAASFDFTGLRQRKLDMYLRVCVLVHVQPHMHAPRWICVSVEVCYTIFSRGVGEWMHSKAWTLPPGTEVQQEGCWCAAASALLFKDLFAHKVQGLSYRFTVFQSVSWFLLKYL